MKRKFFVFIGAFIVLLLLSFVILVVCGTFGTRNELARVSAGTNGLETSTYDGVGINLDYIPTTNMIRDPSFETETNYETITVAYADEEYIFFNSEDFENLRLLNNTLSSATVRVFSIDEQGTMVLKYSGAIQGYDFARIGTPVEIEDLNGYWLQDVITDVEYLDNTVVALTESGKLIVDLTDEQLVNVIGDDELSFTSICCNGSEIIAATETGIFYSSSDGRNFSELSSDYSVMETLIDNSLSIESIACVGKTIVSSLSDGRALILSDGESFIISLSDGASIERMITSNNRILIATSDDKVFVSSNGIVFSQNLEIEQAIAENSDANVSVIDATSYNDDFYLLMSDGSVLTIEYAPNDELSIEHLAGIADINSNPESIVVSSESELLILADDNSVYLVSSVTGVASVISAEDAVYDEIFAAPNGKIITMRNGEIGITSVYSDIKIDGNVGEDTLLAGDICYIETGLSPVAGGEAGEDGWLLSGNNSTWDCYGTNSNISVVNDAATGYGSSCARVTGLSQGIHMISQQIPGTASEIFTEDSFYRIDLYLKESGLDDANVSVWLSGAGFTETGFVIEDVSSKYSLYSYVFAVNENMLMGDEPIRLNIAFEGEGVLYVDGIYLGLDKYDASSIPDIFADTIIDANPSAIRLNNLMIGQSEMSSDSLYSMTASSDSINVYADEQSIRVAGCTSLEDSLRLVRESSSTPWFVIGSCANQATIDAFLDYMCGSVSSAYGKVRIDNGTALPWSRQFETIYIEINDSENCFASDIQRSAYVDYITGLIRESEYYNDIKDKVVFLDGMTYEGGVMLSSADYHCSQVSIDYELDEAAEMNPTFIQYTNEVYDDLSFDSPRVTTHGNESGEFISSLSISSSSYNSTDVIISRTTEAITSGAYLSAILSDNAGFVSMTMFDVPVSYRPIDTESFDVFVPSDLNGLERTNAEVSATAFFGFLQSVRPLNYLDRSSSEVLDPVDEDSAVTADGFNQCCDSVIFSGEAENYIYISNSSNTQQQFVIEQGNVDTSAAQYSRYSSSGQLIQSSSLRYRVQRITLQAGEYIIITY